MFCRSIRRFKKHVAEEVEQQQLLVSEKRQKEATHCVTCSFCLSQSETGEKLVIQLSYRKSYGLF